MLSHRAVFTCGKEDGEKPVHLAVLVAHFVAFSISRTSEKKGIVAYFVKPQASSRLAAPLVCSNLAATLKAARFVASLLPVRFDLGPDEWLLYWKRPQEQKRRLHFFVW